MFINTTVRYKMSEKEKDAFDGLFDDVPVAASTITTIPAAKAVTEPIVKKDDPICPVKTIPSTDAVKEVDIAEKVEYPVLMGSEKFPDDYKTLYSRIIMQYRMLPKINYDETYKEISVLSIKSCPTPSLSDLNSELEKVQAAKDRLCEIFIDVNRCYTFKKRAVDIVRDSWLKFAGGKAEGKNESIRKGESVYISSDFEIDLAQTEALIQACKHIIKNLDSLTENLSRRITIIQLQVKVQDIGRGMSPDFVFDKRATADISLSEMTEEIDVGEKPVAAHSSDDSEIV